MTAQQRLKATPEHSASLYLARRTHARRHCADECALLRRKAEVEDTMSRIESGVRNDWLDLASHITRVELAHNVAKLSFPPAVGGAAENWIISGASMMANIDSAAD
jgi:hypothetical protein